MPRTPATTINNNTDMKSHSEFYRAATSTLITAKGLIFPSKRFAAPPAPAATASQSPTSTAATPPPMVDTAPVDAAPVQGKPIRENGQPTDEDMVAINRIAKSGNVDPASVYVFDAAISNQRVDSFFTRMDISSLQYYVQDALNGVPVMNSHRTGGYASQSELPIGRSFWGGLDADPQLPGTNRAIASAYMLRSNQANGAVNTADIIAGIEAGINSDVSIGFYFSPGTPQNQFQDKTWLECSICNADFLATDYWDESPNACHHWPGEMYDGQLCYLNVMNARLSEFSTVYAGACEGAVVLKAERAASAGTLSRSQMRLLGDNYGVRFNQRGIAVVAKSNVPILHPRNFNDNSSNNNSSEVIQVPKTQPIDAAAAGDVSAKEFLTSRLQKVTDTFPRAMSDDEMEMAQNAIDCMASGDMDTAMQHISSLLAASTQSPEPLDEGEVTAGQMDAPTDGGTETDMDEAPATANYEMDNGADAVDSIAADTATDVESDNAGLDNTADESSQDEDDEDETASTTLHKGRSVALELTIKERQQLQTARTEITDLKREINRLAPFAKYGQDCFNALVNETVLQANRAQIAGVNEDVVRDMCKRMTPAQIEALHNTYKEMADVRFSNVDNQGNATMRGGRQSEPLKPNTPATLWQKAMRSQGLYMGQTGYDTRADNAIDPDGDLAAYR